MKYQKFAHHQNLTPETVITLVDMSPSMDDDDWKPSRLKGAIQANIKLIESIAQSYPHHQVGIIGFSQQARILHVPEPVIQYKSHLIQALKNRIPSSGTNFTAALQQAQQCLFPVQPTLSTKGFLFNLWDRFLLGEEMEQQVSDHSITKEMANRIILLSDGEHNQGGCPVMVANALKQNGVVIDCIGIGGSPRDVDEKMLKKIASQNPDGSIRYCFIGDQNDLIRKYEKLAHHIRPA